MNKTHIEYPEEFDHVRQILVFGAEKYGVNSWLQDGLNPKDNHASMSRHLAEAYAGLGPDHESGLDPLLHLASRALMAYTLKQRGKYGD